MGSKDVVEEEVSSNSSIDIEISIAGVCPVCVTPLLPREDDISVETPRRRRPPECPRCGQIFN